MKALPDFMEFKVFYKSDMKSLFTAADDETIDLLKLMLLFDPEKRISVDKVH